MSQMNGDRPVFGFLTLMGQICNNRSSSSSCRHDISNSNNNNNNRTTNSTNVKRYLRWLLVGLSMLGNLYYTFIATAAIQTTSYTYDFADVDHHHNKKELSVPEMTTPNSNELDTTTIIQNTNSFSSSPLSSKLQSGTVIQQETEEDIVGAFNGYDVVYRDTMKETSNSALEKKLYSSVRCIGETFTNESWMYRSCSFQNLCFDLDTKEFVLFRSPQERNLEKNYHDNDNFHNQKKLHFISTIMNDKSVSIGALCAKWGWDPNVGNPSLEWFPTIIDVDDNTSSSLSSSPTSWYEFANPQTIFIPFQPLAGNNLGHLLWDSFLPIYSLLELFQWTKIEHHQLALVRYNKLPMKNRTTHFGATCTPYHKCRATFDKAAPLMGIKRHNLKSSEQSTLNLTSTVDEAGSTKTTTATPQPRSKYVCSKHGAAGLGMLSDHGKQSHGFFETPMDFHQPHNVGRGSMLWNFRNYMMNHIGISDVNDVDPPMTIQHRRPPQKVVFSILSSGNPTRVLKFAPHREALEKSLADRIANGSIELQVVQFSKQSMVDQIRLMTETSILVTACGGGAVTSLFLPKGANLILYDDNSEHTGGRLDFAYLNNAAYIHTHWLPIQGMKVNNAVDMFVNLVENLLQQE